MVVVTSQVECVMQKKIIFCRRMEQYGAELNAYNKKTPIKNYLVFFEFRITKVTFKNFSRHESNKS